MRSIWIAILTTLLLHHRCDALSAQPSTLWRKFMGKRTDGPSRLPQAVSIGPSQYFEGADGPWQVQRCSRDCNPLIFESIRSSFPIQVGSGNVYGRQDVRVFPSTAGNGIWTIGTLGCPEAYPSDCSNSRGGLFLVNESLTWVPTSSYDVGLESDLGMDASSPVGFDVATLGWPGSQTITVDHSVIWNLASSAYWLGTFGLNPRPMNFSTFSDPQTSFMQNALDANAISSLSYGYTAGNRYRLDNIFGSLTLGGYDANRFIPNNITFDFFEDISRDLLVNLQSISSDKTSPSNLLPGGSIPIFIDSTIAELYLPESARAAFEKAFGIEWNSAYSRYLITPAQRERLLAQDSSVTFTLGPSPTGGETVDITLPYRAFDLQVTFPIVMHPNTSYYFPLMRAENVTQYTLGRTFLQEAYLIADYERQNFSISQCEWDQAKLATENIVTISPPNATTLEDKDRSRTIIVGAAVAAAALLIICISLHVFFARRRRQQERQRAIFAAKIAEYDAAAAASVPRAKISHPIGGELGGSGLHEMAVQKMRTPELGVPKFGNPDRHGYSEVTSGHYYGTGKYVRASVMEMDAPKVVFELDGNCEKKRERYEKGPPTPPK